MKRPPATETEAKIPVSDLEAVRRRLTAQGGTCIHPCSREHNTLFDFFARQTLARSGRALRLRRYGERWLLTFKDKARYHEQVKQRQELELGIEDGELLAEIFDRLGLVPSRRYEKDREVWRLGRVEVALDHTPMGDFVELEGPLEQLAGVARQLGLEVAAAVRGSYLSLWRRYRQERAELPEDMLFDAHPAAEPDE